MTDCIASATLKVYSVRYTLIPPPGNTSPSILKLTRKLIALLKVLGIGQTNIAGRLGVTKGLVSQWVHGRRPLAEHHKNALLQLLDEGLTTDFERTADAMQHTPSYGARDKLGKLHRSKAWLTLEAHRNAVEQAIYEYEVAVQCSLEQFSPGAGLRDLHSLADRAINCILLNYSGEKSAKTWTCVDQLGLKATCEDLIRVVDAIMMVASAAQKRTQPIGRTQTATLLVAPSR